MVNLVKVFTKRVVSINREIRRNDGKARAGVNFRLKKIGHDAALVVVPDS